MWHLESKHRAAMRHGLGRSGFGRWIGFLLLCAMLAVPGISRASCPDFTPPNASAGSPMPAGGTIVIDASACPASGFGQIGDIVTPPSHGTAMSNHSPATITYVNNGDGATLDTFTFNDGSSSNPPITVTLHIAAPTSSISITPTSLPSGRVAVAYPSTTLTASGGATPYTYALTAGSLPTGLTLSSGGTISGTPSAYGTFTFTVTATDNASATGNQSYSVTIAPATINVTGTPAVATLNAPYSFTPSASGGTPPYTYALHSGALPAGLSLNASTGTISGTPTALGASTFTLRVSDSSTPTPLFNDVSFTINVQDNPPVANNVSATVAYGSASNPVTLNITGGTPTSVAVGTAPAHGTANATGTSITYTPTPGYAGPDSFTYTASNSGGTSAPATVTITVSAPTIVYTPSSPPAGTVGTAYSQSIAGASGGASPYTYTIVSGSLPAGMTLAGNGTLSGTPTAGGSFDFTVKATDSSTGTGPFSATSGTLTLTVNAPTITLAPVSLTNPTVGAAYSQNVTASGGTGPYTYAVTAGTLPAGLSLGGTGALSGTPTSAGTYNVTITATDSSTGTGPYAGSRAYTITVAAAALTMTPAPGTINGTAGSPMNATFAAANGTAPYTYTVSAGALPPGVTLASTGALSGTPTAAGTFNVSIEATDSSTGTGAPFHVTQSYTLAIAPPTIALSPPTLPNPTVGVAYAQSVMASGGIGSYTYAVTAGALPTGLALGASGALTGMPTSAGTFNFTVTATDTGGFTGSQAYSVTVGAGTVVVNPGTLANTPAEAAYTHTFTASGGTAPYTFSLSAGALPPGLALSSAGVLSGTPTAAGTFNFTIKATDSSTGTGAPFSATQPFSLTVTAPTITVSPATLPNATGSTAYNQTLAASGGNGSYTYSLAAGGLPPGIALSSSGTVSGTPTTAGTFNFTVMATDGFGFTGSQAYTFTVNAPTITVSPATLPGGQVSAAYAQHLSASGGSGAYTYSLASGALPPGIALGSSGAISGTPTVAGNYNFTVTATDGFGFSGSQAYSLGINQPVPVAVNDTATTAANAPVTINVTANDTGPITSIAVAQAPAHGSATVNALNVVYTPASNFFGTDTFTYTATGPGGTSAPATVTVTVTPLAVPVAAAQSATVLAGQSVTVHATAGATGAPYTAVAIATPPAKGTAAVSGTDIVYTAPIDASGAVGIDYTLSNPFGTSQPAHITITVNPVPLPAALTANVVAGRTVQVDLTSAAHGGPFTAATLIAVSPASAGHANIHNSGTSGYTLEFTAANTYSGQAQVSYTLSNAYATSATATVTITVTGRSDPSKDAEVLGILQAQADSARRLAVGQINNFQRRLETLHTGAAGGGFTNGLSFSSASARQHRDPLAGLRGRDDDWSRRFLVQPDEPSPGQGQRNDGGGQPGEWSVWTGGAVNFGKTQPGSSDDGIDFTTSGISLGADRAFGDQFAAGAGIGYGHDASDVGKHDSRSTVDAYSAAIYGSYRPAPLVYVDALIGYQKMSFDAHRYVTDNGNTVTGSRDGKQWFASISVGYEHRAQDGMLVSPYARFDFARATLDSYTEHGDDVYALHYERQTVKTSTGVLGLRAQWTVKRDYGVWMPQLRAEFRHDFQGASIAAMRYADLLGGPLYQAALGNTSRNHTLVGAGVMLQTLSGWSLRMEYQNLLDNSTRDNQSIQLGVEKKFDP
jgi:uncharacterized protein with beta-barrel porin domain